MKNASSSDKPSSTTVGKTDFASRMKNFISSSPLIKRRRSMSVSSVPLSGSSRVFGVPLSDVCEGGVPFIIRKIVEHIEKHGLDTEGVYRINGNAKIIEKLRQCFDKVGDANFEGEDIPPIAGLLKLFLRELPDGLIPGNKMSEFVALQQQYPSEVTPEAISNLKGLIHTLPQANYTTLKYLIRHLAKVADHKDVNKMTPVSLSIVFGPNIFHCGEGLQALQLQGFSNSAICRMVLNHEALFGGVEEVKIRKRSKSSPVKPRPYSEYIAEKNEGSLSPIQSSPLNSTSDLERTYSEISIDEAIQERTSPAHIQDSTSQKSPPLQPPPPKLKTSPQDSETSKQRRSSFHRQYAKRGLKYNQHSLSALDNTKPENQGTEVKVQSPDKGQSSNTIDKLCSPEKSENSPKTGGMSRNKSLSIPSRDENEGLLQTSTQSLLSSFGSSPPTSPTITPRSSKVLGSVIDDSIQQYLFQPQSHSTQPLQTPKADVYGLLLPDSTSDQSDSQSSQPLTDTQSTNLQSSSTQGPLEVKHNPQGDIDKLKYRKSSLYKTEVVTSNGPIDDACIKILTVSPENSFNGGVIESHQGKLSELVAKFEGQGVEGGTREGVEGVDGDDMNERKKRKPSNKAFEMFEKKGVLIGMGGPNVPKVSFASTATTISLSPSPSPSPAHQPTPSNSSLPGVSLFGSEELTTGSKLSTSTAGDEDVFTSPTHTSTPSQITPSVVSDDVFEPPAHTVGESNDRLEFDRIRREKILEHANLSRPKGPANRRRPSRSPKSTGKIPSEDQTSALNSDSNILSPVMPEERSKVEEGWCEGVEEVDSGTPFSTDPAVRAKELTNRINELKKEVRQFEAGFFSTHYRKPLGEERAPVRLLLEESTALKRQLKSLQGTIKPESEEQVSGKSTKSLSQPITTKQQSTKRTKSIDLTSIETTNPFVEKRSKSVEMKPSQEVEGKLSGDQKSLSSKNDSRRAQSSSGQSRSNVESPLEGTLNKLMGSLERRRLSSSRPENVYAMTVDQLLQEKRDIQKALLQFEKAHGRPTSNQDKETMRPLYDRYRLIKRLAANPTAIPSRHSLGGLETTTDTLPSVTLLHSSTLGFSTSTVSEGRSLSDTTRNRSIEIMSDSQLRKATVEELIQQNKLLLDTKKELRVTLKDYENKFQTEHGRSVQREDRGAMQEDYAKYKEVKTKLKIVASQLSKNLPQKTI